MSCTIISNAFSLNMVKPSLLSRIEMMPIYPVSGTDSLEFTDEAGVMFITPTKSVVGHADTANVLSDTLGHTVEFNRESVELCGTDWLVVAQYKGPRLEEGCTSLPDGAVIDYVLVRFKEVYSIKTGNSYKYLTLPDGSLDDTCHNIRLDYQDNFVSSEDETWFIDKYNELNK